MADRSLGRSVGNLLLALVNATLILAALCLWLAWNVLSTARDVSDRLNTAAANVVPIRGEITALTAEIAGARADLAARSSLAEGAAAGIEARIAGVEDGLDTLNETIAGLGAEPESLVDTAVRAGFDALGDAVADLLADLRGGPALPTN